MSKVVVTIECDFSDLDALGKITKAVKNLQGRLPDHKVTTELLQDQVPLIVAAPSRGGGLDRHNTATPLAPLPISTNTVEKMTPLGKMEIDMGDAGPIPPEQRGIRRVETCEHIWTDGVCERCGARV